MQNIQALAQREQRNIQNTNKPSGVILLITDGDANEGYDPKDVLPLLQKQHIPVFVLGIGTAKYLMGYDRFQQAIVSNINTSLLEMIAKQT
ncbi:MAG: VWA domain-containing protein [bacterium]